MQCSKFRCRICVINPFYSRSLPCAKRRGESANTIAFCAYQLYSKKQKSSRLLLSAFCDANTRPCHPERSNYFTASCEILRSRTRPKEGARSAGSTGESCAPRRSSKRVPRFDFQKSAICCRFLKVRLRKHPPGMFSPLRMTRTGMLLYFLRLFCSPIESVFLFGFDANQPKAGK